MPSWISKSCMFSNVLLTDKSTATIGLKPALLTNSETVCNDSSLLPAINASTCLPSITGVAKSAANVVLNAFTTFELGRSFCNSSAALVSGAVTKPLKVWLSGLEMLMTIF